MLKWVKIKILLMVICVMSNSIEKTSEKMDVNPHLNPPFCASCHESTNYSKTDIGFGGDITKMCQSCHDGRKAAREVHPFGIKPGKNVKKQIPSQFPLSNGRLTCLSCHDVSSQCNGSLNDSKEKNNFLRGNPSWSIFCFQCHDKRDYLPFNAHDQIDVQTGKIKEKTCLWCHTEVPTVSQKMRDSKFFGLRNESHLICSNCHPVDKTHPIDGQHILVKPSKKTFAHMAKYVGVSPSKYRFFQVFPVDEAGRITCFSCHNPHEKGLFTDFNPRSLGADPKISQHKRLRRRNVEERSCIICHPY